MHRGSRSAIWQYRLLLPSHDRVPVQSIEISLRRGELPQVFYLLHLPIIIPPARKLAVRLQQSEQKLHAPTRVIELPLMSFELVKGH
jgi:hypothetical protein